MPLAVACLWLSSIERIYSAPEVLLHGVRGVSFVYSVTIRQGVCLPMLWCLYSATAPIWFGQSKGLNWEALLYQVDAIRSKLFLGLKQPTVSVRGNGRLIFS